MSHSILRHEMRGNVYTCILIRSTLLRYISGSVAAFPMTTLHSVCHLLCTHCPSLSTSHYLFTKKIAASELKKLIYAPFKPVYFRIVVRVGLIAVMLSWFSEQARHIDCWSRIVNQLVS